VIPIQLEAEAATLTRELALMGAALPPLPRVKLKVLDYQLAALWLLARQYNTQGARILEIGTGHGGSGYVISNAAPLAQITSLTAEPREVAAAGELWRRHGCRNIAAQAIRSWDYLSRASDAVYDLVFVDGDHNRIALDLPWFERLRPGGLLLCHDYSPQDSRTPSRIVYEELNRMAADLGRPFDVRLVDEGKVGMVGFYRRDGETLCSRPQIIAPRLDNLGACVITRELTRQVQPPGVQVIVADDWALSWRLNLFVGRGAPVPWELLGAGFRILERWDAAVPFASEHVLAQDVGTSEERALTEEAILDLRVPIHAPEQLLFVAATDVGRALVKTWREECQQGPDERLAFLRALATVKPRLCVLPRLWLASAAEREDFAANYKSKEKKRRKPLFGSRRPRA
jgi:predicted O-methyltransferase YrrM